MDDFPNLEACCGGTINPENLRRFQKAMREYEVFMRGLEALFAPRHRDQLDAG
jgi:hypothetical protein